MSGQHSAKSPRKWHVTVIEWLAHKGTTEASSTEEAEAIARELWADKGEHEVFRFSDSGLEDVVVDEV